MDALYLKKLQEMEEARQQGLRQMDEARQRGLSDIEQQQDLFNSKNQPSSVEDVAKAEALQKMTASKNENLISDRIGNSGLNLTKRTYGPYELYNKIEAMNDPSMKDNQKQTRLTHELRYLGGDHSEKDIRKIAEELKDIGKPADYKHWDQVLRQLKPYKEDGEQDSYIKTINRSSAGEAPLWPEFDELQAKRKK